MAKKRIAYFEYGRVYPAPEGASANDAPLTRGNPPVTPEPESEQEPTAPPRVHICRGVAFLWNVAFVSLVGALIIYLIQCPAEALWPPTPLECALGLIIGFALCGITLALHRCAQRNGEM